MFLLATNPKPKYCSFICLVPPHANVYLFWFNFSCQLVTKESLCDILGGKMAQSSQIWRKNNLKSPDLDSHQFLHVTKIQQDSKKISIFLFHMQPNLANVLLWIITTYITYLMIFIFEKKPCIPSPYRTISGPFEPWL